MEKIENTSISTTIKDCIDKPLNNKWKKRLDDYNNYTIEYIKHYQKSLQGNSISLSIYPYMKARTEALYEQLFDAKNKSLLTKKQIKKMCKIQFKLQIPFYTKNTKN